MPLGRKKWLTSVGLLLAALVIVVVSIPLWLPWVLRPLTNRFGGSYLSYERRGYNRFALTDFTYTNSSVRITARHVIGLAPANWLWGLLKGRSTNAAPYLLIKDWRVQMLPGTNPAPSSVYSEFQTLQKDFAFLRSYVPAAELTNGMVLAHGEQIDISQALWSRGRLSARVAIPAYSKSALVEAEISSAPPYHLEIQSATLHLQSSLALSTNQTVLNIQSTNEWWGNPIYLSAQFGRSNTLPQTAEAQAPQFVLPALALGIPDYQDIKGTAVAHWVHGSFSLDFGATALPQKAEAKLPPLEARIHARGDTNRAILESARIDAPWLRAELARELIVYFNGPYLREPAALHLTADLDRQNGFPMRGKLSADALLTPGSGEIPDAQVNLKGSNVGNTNLTARSIYATAALRWPWLTVSQAQATFSEGSEASLTARMDITNRLVEGGTMRFAGPLLHRWLPSGYSYDGLKMAGDFGGPITNLSHSGGLTISRVTSPDLRPFKLQLDWAGRMENLTRVAAEIATSSASLKVQGALSVTARGGTLTLNGLSLSTNQMALLSLQGPSRVEFIRASGTNGTWRAELTALDLTGQGGQLHADAHVTWPNIGDVNATLRHLHSALLDGFLKTNPPPVTVTDFDVSARWSNSPVVFSAGLLVNYGGEIPLEARVETSGDELGITLRQFQLVSKSTPVISAQGFLPLNIDPADVPKPVHFLNSKSLRVVALAQPQDMVWGKLADWTGVRLRSPYLDLALTGTWNQPLGHLHLRAAQVQMDRTNTPLPALTDLHLNLVINHQLAKLTNSGVLIAGEPLDIGARLPLGNQAWAELLRKKLPKLDEATAFLRMQNAKLASFADLYPKLVAPQGVLNVDIALRPGFQLFGEFTLHDARTHPIASLGPIRDIDARVQLDRHSILLKSATASIGSGQIQMDGEAQIDLAQLKSRSLLPFFFHLAATNVPLVREPAAIVRGDLLLNIGHTSGAPPLITGQVKLADSYYLSDLTALIPGQVTAPGQRPPYFSVENPLFAPWGLALHVSGDRFIKVRTTVFNGEVSANCEIEGTLGSPLAIGDVTVSSGQVSFPFGNLDVKQGLVTLTSENPYHPQLNVNAETTQFGYDIKMQVTGPVDAPVIQFISTPPLSSEQILLLLTTGSLPQGGFTLTSQQRAQTLAVFLARDLLTKLGFGAGASARLTFRSGQEISETGRPTYSIEFKLTSNWSLVAEYDRFGDYDAGLKWRIYSK